MILKRVPFKVYSPNVYIDWYQCQSRPFFPSRPPFTPRMGRTNVPEVHYNDDPRSGNNNTSLNPRPTSVANQKFSSSFTSKKNTILEY